MHPRRGIAIAFGRRQRFDLLRALEVKVQKQSHRAVMWGAHQQGESGKNPLQLRDPIDENATQTHSADQENKERKPLILPRNVAFD
jgi:hypothetical protein